MTQPQDTSFADLVARHQGVVCGVAYAVLRDRARSEEIAQDAFLIAWQKLPSLAEPPELPGWLCGIARNLARNAARRRKETAMDTDAPEPTNDRSPLIEILAREADAIAHRALASLPERDREIVVLYYRGHGTIEDVAHALGMAPAAARKRLERARTRLRAAIGSIEATLRSTRPGPAFTAACVTALAAGALPSPADAAPRGTLSRLALPAASLAVVGAWLAVGVAHHDTSPARHVTTAQAATRPGSIARASEPAAIVRAIDRDMRASLAARIEAARATRAPVARDRSAAALPAPTQPTRVYDFAGSALDDATPLPPPADPHVLSKVTLRYAIRQIQPLLLECYAAASDRLQRESGTIEVALRLVTDPDVATIVDSASLAGDAPALADHELVDCMHETLMSIEMPAMTVAATIDVTYPFVIR